jgi:cyclic lactone autoinducer peptide
MKSVDMKGGISLKHLLIKMGTSLAGLALMVTTLNVNTACMLFVHQPKLPDNAGRLRRF